MMMFDWTWREYQETPVVIIRHRQLVEATRAAVRYEVQARNG